MVLKKFAAGCFVVFLITLLVACGSDNGISGEGKIIELKPSEVQEFANEKGGFIYVKSSLNSNNDDDKMIMREINRIAEKKEVNFFIYDPEKHQKFIELNGIKPQEIGFYQNGNKKAELDLSDVEKTKKVAKAIPSFIEKVKNNYFE